MKPMACVALAAAVMTLGCSSGIRQQQEQGSVRSPSAPELMIHYGCPTCHVISGVPGAVGKVGPSLASLGQRSYLAGVLPNSPADLQRWLMHPQGIHPGTAMPEMGIPQADAQVMAVYLEEQR